MAKSAPAKKAPRQATSVKSVQKSVSPEEALSPRDLAALDEAAAFVNNRIDRSAEALIEIGQYLLKRFFDDTVEKVGDRAPRKGVSLRKLAEHPDILMSYPQLSRSVGLAVQELQLASVSTLKQLTASHKLMLLGIDDRAGLGEKELMALKKRYVSMVEKDGLSVRALRDVLENDGYVKRRGLAAIEDAGERRLLRSGIHKMLDPFESIAGLDIKRLLALPSPNLRSAYDVAKKARLRLDTLINGMEQRLRG
ncbi:MAG: hypothetical protein IT350_10815 [Deltaproteobacteria bacterium]|nr:hypothetical protein [Deltaproteobacteria bacterium]